MKNQKGARLGSSSHGDQAARAKSLAFMKFMFVAAFVFQNIEHSMTHLEQMLYVDYSHLNGTDSTDGALTVHQISTNNNTAITDSEHAVSEANMQPAWFKEYIQWHRETRAELNETNWNSHKYLLLRCVKSEVCSGASDRLQNIPTIIRVAAMARRLFFIHWSKPCALEEFLVPPIGGLDWSLPSWLVDKLEANKRIGPLFSFGDISLTEEIVRELPQNEAPIMRLVKLLNGRDHYNKMRQNGTEDPDFHNAYSGIWQALFEPSPGVEAVIRQTKRELGLHPNEPYNAVHLRVRHTKDKLEHHLEIKALNCALQLAPNATDPATPIFVASDTVEAVRNAIQYGKEKGLNVVGRTNNISEPLHLDRGSSFLEVSDDWKHRDPTDFYHTFADVYLMAGARCISYGEGGYGSWATLIGHSFRCSNNHVKQTCPAIPAVQQ